LTSCIYLRCLIRWFTCDSELDGSRLMLYIIKGRAEKILAAVPTDVEQVVRRVERDREGTFRI
jgi:hypothetical protein